MAELLQHGDDRQVLGSVLGLGVGLKYCRLQHGDDWQVRGSVLGLGL